MHSIARQKSGASVLIPLKDKSIIGSNAMLQLLGASQRSVRVDYLHSEPRMLTRMYLTFSVLVYLATRSCCYIEELFAKLVSLSAVCQAL